MVYQVNWGQNNTLHLQLTANIQCRPKIREWVIIRGNREQMDWFFNTVPIFFKPRKNHDMCVSYKPFNLWNKTVQTLHKLS